MNSSGAAIHAVSPSDSGPPMREADEAGGVLSRDGLRRRTRPQMPQPESGQHDHRRAEDQPWPRLGVGLGAHQHHGDRGQRDRQQHDRGTDEHPQERVDPRPDRPRRVEPGTRGDHHGDAEQRQGDAVAAVARLEVAGPADRARRRSCALGQHQPARAHTAADGRACRRNRRRDSGAAPAFSVARSARLAREPVFDLLERLPDRAAVLLGMPVRLVAIAP